MNLFKLFYKQPENKTKAAAFCCGFLLLIHCFLQCFSQLIGARSGLHTTVYTLDSLNNFIDIHALNKFADALEITVAASNKLNIADFTLNDLKKNSL
jgi:hypothetical protein